MSAQDVRRMQERRARKDFIMVKFSSAEAGLRRQTTTDLSSQLMQLPCRGALEKRSKKLCFPALATALEKPETEGRQGQGSGDPGRDFRHRHHRDDLEITAAERDLGCPGKTAETETAKVGALVVGKDQAIGRRRAQSAGGTCPVRDRQCVGAGSKRSECQDSDRAGSEIDRSPRQRQG